MPVSLTAKFLLLVGFVSVVSDNLEARAMPKAAISEHIQRYIDENRLHGLSIGVVQDDSEWAAHFGRLSDDDPRSAADDTLYEIGSITKVFTGLLLANAVQERELKLEQAIGSVVPDLNERNPKVAQSITLRHLATHDSGLARMPNNMRPADPENPAADYTPQLLFDYMSSVIP